MDIESEGNQDLLTEEPFEIDLFSDQFSQIPQVNIINNLPAFLQSKITNKISDLKDCIKENNQKPCRSNVLLTKILSDKYKANFISDIAAKAHIILDKELFSSFYNCISYVSWGKAKTLAIKGYGTVCLEFTATNEQILLHNCLYMPEIGINIISQGSLREITSLFTYNYCYLQRNKTVITQGEKIGNLYYLLVKVIKTPKIHHTTTKYSSIIELIHQQFGHIGAKALYYLPKVTTR